MAMTVKEALKLVLAEMNAMTPEQLRAELDAHKDGSLARGLREAQAFLYAAENEEEVTPLFRPGDVIEFGERISMVVDNYGTHGLISDMDGTYAFPHNWNSPCGTRTRYATRNELSPYLERKLPKAAIGLESLELREAQVKDGAVTATH